MKTFTYTIKDELGIHVRPAGLLAKVGKKYDSAITIEKDGKSSDVTRLMAVMAMGVKCGETVTITVTGTDEEVAYQETQAFFEENL